MLTALLSWTAVAQSEQPQRVSACDLNSNPAAFQHKLIEVTAFVSHGFEDFTLIDPACSGWPRTWAEYGGAVWDTVSTSVIEDRTWREFDRLIRLPPDRIVRATLVGRFFAGRQRVLPSGGVEWSGYGHLACCSLLVIQQVVTVEPQIHTDLDYRATADQPDISKAGCSYRDFLPLDATADLVAAQQAADTDRSDWHFTDPQRVAVGSLAKFLKIPTVAIAGLKQTGHAQGRMLYQWTSAVTRKKYLVVVSRPYWLSFYAKDPGRTAWVAIAAFESTCR